MPGRYRHFKGGEYEVLEVARHSETEELLVVYCSLDDPATTWVRPVEMFRGVVEGPEGLIPRFELTTPLKRRSGGLMAGLLLRVLKLAGAVTPSSLLRPRRVRRSMGSRAVL